MSKIPTHTTKRAAVVMNLIAVLCWSIAPPMVHYVQRYFPINFQNFFRYLFSLLILWPFFFITSGKKNAIAAIKNLVKLYPKILFMALINYLFQLTYTYGVFKLLPGIFTLIQQSQILFSVFLAILLFPDEKRILKNVFFTIGIVTAVTGVTLTIVGGKEMGKVEFGLGVLSSFASAGFWALLGSLIKKWLHQIPPALSVTSIITIVTPFFLLTHIATGTTLPALDIPLTGWILMLLSGFIGVGLGQSMYYRAVPVLGIATSTSIGLLLPFTTGLISFIVFGETLTPIQLLGGTLLIIGSYVVIKIRFKYS